MIDCNFNASNFTNEELINRLKHLADFYWEYWDLEKLELLEADTAAVLYEAAKRLEKFYSLNTNEICECFRPNMYKDSIDRCFGTKEIDPCNCNGDKNKCNFYNKGEN